MKKLLTLLLFIPFASSQAQQLGVKGGPTYGNLNIGDFETKNRIGYHFGGFITLPVTDNFYFSPRYFIRLKAQKLHMIFSS